MTAEQYGSNDLSSESYSRFPVLIFYGSLITPSPSATLARALTAVRSLSSDTVRSDGDDDASFAAIRTLELSVQASR